MKVSTWNLNWLVAPESLSKYQLPNDIPRRTAKDWQKISDYAQKLSADILLFEEIDGIDAAEKLLSPQEYIFLQTHGKMPQNEVLAIRKNLHVNVIQHADFQPLAENPNSPYPLRAGLDVTLLFPNHTSLRLLGVHLKAGCWERAETEKKHSCPLLYKQFGDLRNWIEQRERENQDYLLLGDFNRRLSKSDFIFQKLIPSNRHPLVLTSSGLASPCQGGEYFIDHLILRQSEKITFEPNSLRVQLFAPQDQKETISDHCPVSIKLTL